jgi:hypothetical protein
MGKVLIELVGLDVAETIEKAIANEKTYQLRCLVADFAVHNGLMETQMLLVDTTDTKVARGVHQFARKKGRTKAGAQGERLQSVFGAGATVYPRPLSQAVCWSQAG